jgi:glyoxylase-like metal-dependent hydrolase (beta-lactamase superfamily II)
MRAWLLAVLLSVTVCGHAAEAIYPGYSWQALGSGVYLHSQNDPLAGPVDGNSVVIVGDAGVLVVDTHINPAAARAVIRKIRALTGVPVTHVVNTHWHDDHTNGNHAYRQAFPGVKIIAHVNTLKSLHDEWEAMEEQRRTAYAEVDPEELQREAAALDGTAPDTAIMYRVYSGYVAALRPELAGLVLEYPDTVFESALAIDLGNRRVEISWPGRGNTDGDAVVWLPDERVLVTGDLLVAPIPFAFDSPMADWGATLRRLGELDADVIVPGHGAPQYDGSYIASVQALLEATTSRVQAAHQNATAFEDLGGAVNLDEFRREFAGEDPQRQWAWQTYFVDPGLKSAWTSLGYPLSTE